MLLEISSYVLERSYPAIQPGSGHTHRNLRLGLPENSWSNTASPELSISTFYSLELSFSGHLSHDSFLIWHRFLEDVKWWLFPAALDSSFSRHLLLLMFVVLVMAFFWHRLASFQLFPLASPSVTSLSDISTSLPEAVFCQRQSREKLRIFWRSKRAFLTQTASPIWRSTKAATWLSMTQLLTWSRGPTVLHPTM